MSKTAFYDSLLLQLQALIEGEDDLIANLANASALLNLALEDLKEIAEELSDIAAVEQAPALEGKTMSMVLAPSRAPKKKTEGEAKPEAPKPAEG